LYLIQYEDDDEEEFDEKELQVHHQHFLQKKKVKWLLSLNRAEKHPPLVGEKEAKGTPPTKKQKTRHGSSIWNLLDPVNGQPVTSNLIQSLVAKSPPPKDQLPPNLRPCIPKMVEFFVFMLEREYIQNRKETTIELMKTHHFLHNNRELDRGTAYFRSQILKLIHGSGSSRQFDRLEWTKHVLAMSFYYRQCNLIETFDREANPARGIPHLGKFNKAFIDYLLDCEEKNITVFTSAYLNQGFERYIRYSKSQTRTIVEVATFIAELKDFDMKSVCSKLQTLHGVGDFLAWQIACDLEEARCLVRCFEPEDTYCMLGPGAKKGLVKIFGSEYKNGNASQLTLHLLDNMGYCLHLVHKKFPLWRNKKVTIKVIEHALCEFQKFEELDAGNVSWQRKWRSRAARDERDQCPSCKGPPTRTDRCDTCHMIVCENCLNDQFQLCNASGRTCKHCHALEHSEHILI
jgi:alpha-glutamyl/putrescinyl thymine pyrophosphorylase clade 1